MKNLAIALLVSAAVGCASPEPGTQSIASGGTWLDPNTNLTGYAGQAIPALGDALVALPLPDDARLLSVAAFIDPEDGRRVLPERLPRLFVYRIDVLTGERFELGAIDDEGPLDPYEPLHAVALDLPEPADVDAARHTYMALIESEGGAGALPLPLWGVVSEVSQ